MEFSVGDKVIHPKFGAGTITGETHRELVEGFEHYFVIAVMRTGATAYVPKEKMDELGVRLVMSRDKLVQVLSTLRDIPRTLEKDYKERQANLLEKLGTARPIAVAEVIRDLSWRKKKKHLAILVHLKYRSNPELKKPNCALIELFRASLARQGSRSVPFII